MLSLHVCVGESLLARDLWELKLVRVESTTCVFELATLTVCTYTVSRPGGTGAGGLVRPDKPSEIRAGYGSRLMIGASDIRVWPHRKDHGVESVKFAIDAPKEVRFSRPSQHGGSLKPV